MFQFFLTQVVEPVHQLVLNSLELAIENVGLTNVACQEAKIDIDKVVVDSKTEKLIINLTSELQPGQYQLKANFNGAIIDKMKGFYYSKYMRCVILNQ